MRANLHLRKAQQAIYMDDLETAIEQLEAAVENADKEDEIRPEALRNLGFLQVNTGRLEASVETFETYIRDYPNDDQGYFNLKSSYAVTGRKAKIEPMLREGIKKACPPGTLYLALATYLIQDDRREEAMQFLEDTGSKMNDIILSKLTIGLMHQFFDAAEATQYDGKETLERVKRDSRILTDIAAIGARFAGNDIHFMHRYADYARDAERFDEAIEVHSHILQVEPRTAEEENVHILSTIGKSLCHIIKGETGYAVETAENIADHPALQGFTPLQHVIALAYFVEGVDDKALKYCKRITPTIPTKINKTAELMEAYIMSNSFAMTSAIYAKRGDYDKAAILMEASIRSIPAPDEELDETIDAFKRFKDKNGLEGFYYLDKQQLRDVARMDVPLAKTYLVKNNIN